MFALVGESIEVVDGIRLSFDYNGRVIDHCAANEPVCNSAISHRLSA